MNSRIQMPISSRTGMPSLKGPFHGKSASAAIDRMVGNLSASITSAIERRVREQAPLLFRQGYRADELVIMGFGNEVIVQPKLNLRFGRLRLFCRRVVWTLHLRVPPQNRLLDITIADFDTRRIVYAFELLREKGEVRPA